MNVLDLISQWRFIRKDDVTSTDAIVLSLQRADLAVFHALGGLDNPLIAQSLKRLWTDAIVPDRNFFFLPAGSVIVGKVFVADENGVMQQCQTINAEDAAIIDSRPLVKPAALIEKTKVTVFVKGTLSTRRVVNVSYYKPLAEIMYLSGFRGWRDPNLNYGITGGKSLWGIRIVSPTTRPTFLEQELRGAILSLRDDANWRTDYVIEEQESGELTTVFVNKKTYARVQSTDMEFVAGHDNTQNMITISRTSELPEIYHGRIVEAAAGLIATAEKPNE